MVGHCLSSLAGGRYYWKLTGLEQSGRHLTTVCCCCCLQDLPCNWNTISSRGGNIVSNSLRRSFHDLCRQIWLRSCLSPEILLYSQAWRSFCLSVISQNVWASDTNCSETNKRFKQKHIFSRCCCDACSLFLLFVGATQSWIKVDQTDRKATL